MRNTLFLFVYGLLFGVGLIVAGMSNPAKVLAFLDVAGAWDPSLALVMASALFTLVLARLWLRSRNDLADREQGSPAASPIGEIDFRLILGAMIFGIGWGLSGFCPGPALIGLTAGEFGNYVFVVAMFAGFGLFRLVDRR